MKKWTLTILVAACFAAIGFTARWWLPYLEGVATGHKEVIGPLNDLADLAWKIGGLVFAVGAFIYRLWQRNKERPAGPTTTVDHARAGHDVVAAGGDVQTGGTSVRGQGPVFVAGPVAGRDVIIQPVPTASAFNPLHQLPPPPGDFTGREIEMRELREAILAGGATISGLQGQGGVGKTALALKLAEQVSPMFPDAEIYLNLLGIREKPLAPADAMSHVIRAFHPEAKLPEKEHELAGIYQSVLHGKRALLLMDNAKDAAQVRPLIPPAGCAMVVTSRLRFTLPGLQPKNLDTLPPSDAVKLLLKIAPRIDGEASAIAKLCGYLPQALRLAASAVGSHVDLAPADYAKRLADEKNRLKVLDQGSGQSDESMDASISLSYRLLDAEMQKRWRMLAVFPETFDASAAAAIWQIEEDAVKDTLSHLTQYSMLEWNDKAERYRLHDLMRAFAGAKAAADEQETSARRHGLYYLGVLRAAGDLYLEGGESVMRGLALFDAERGNIEAGQAWAAGHAGSDREAARACSGYPDAGVNCLDLRQHPRELISWMEAALKAAQYLKDRRSESTHLGNLGSAYAALGETRRAIEYHERALAIDREGGDRRSEGQDLGNLANRYFQLGEARRAIEYHEEALAILREIGEKRGEGSTLCNLGIDHASLGETRSAIQYYDQALETLRELGDRRAQGNILNNLGSAYADLGETRRAVGHHEQALLVLREIGDRRGEGNALGNLGIAYRRLGNPRHRIL